MSRPTDRIPEQRPFIGRDGILDEFDSTLRVLTLEERQVVVYYGVGGIGKTRLIDELRRRCSELSHLANARLDLRHADNRLPATALMRLRTSFHGIGATFPTFDIAFAVYWSLAYPHIPLRKSELRFLTEGEIAADIIDAFADLPEGRGLLVKRDRCL